MSLIPKGTWRARGVDAELGYTTTRAERGMEEVEQVGVSLVFSPEQDEDVDGRGMTWYGTFSEKAEPFTLKTLRVLGWQGDNLADLTGIDANEVDVVVDHEDDLEGNPRARVRFINPLGSGGVAMKTKMTDDQKRAFAERLRGRVLASKQAAAPQPSAAPKPAAKPASKPASKRQPAAAAPPDDDNIPF